MANRVLLGKRGSSDHGLFVSRSGQDVTNSTQPLGFDSRAAESLITHSTYQGILVPNVQTASGTQVSFVYNSVTENQHTATITHNLGYVPCFAVRWTTYNSIVSGLATDVYPPFSYYRSAGEVTEYDEESDEEIITQVGSTTESGLIVSSTTNNTIVLKNTVRMHHDDDTTETAAGYMTAQNTQTWSRYFWSCIVFTAENFLNGESL